VINRKFRDPARPLAALLAVALAIALTACGSSDDSTSTSATSTPSAANDQPGKGKPAVTIGDKNFTEQYVLGELYAQALRAKGYTVKVKSNIGSSEIIDKALTSGKLASQSGSWITTGITSQRRASASSHASVPTSARKSERTNTKLPAGRALRRRPR